MLLTFFFQSKKCAPIDEEKENEAERYREEVIEVEQVCTLCFITFYPVCVIVFKTIFQDMLKVK